MGWKKLSKKPRCTGGPRYTVECVIRGEYCTAWFRNSKSANSTRKNVYAAFHTASKPIYAAKTNFTPRKFLYSKGRVPKVGTLVQYQSPP